MNTLNLIKKQIEKAAATHDAQINITKYRGVDCAVHQGSEETHAPTIVVVLTSSDSHGTLQITGIVSLGSVYFLDL